MMRNICLSISFSLIFISNIFSQNIFELKGQRIILPPLKTSGLINADYDFETNYICKNGNNINIYKYNSCVYNKNALDKYKFKSKYLYSENIFGDTLDVIDVQRIKKKAVLFVMKHKNDTIALHMPRKWKNKPNLCELFYKYTYKYSGESLYYYYAYLEDIVLNHYNVYSLDSINNRYQDKYVYITSEDHYGHTTYYGYCYSGYDYDGLLKRQVKYKYNGMVFIDNEKFTNLYYYEMCDGGEDKFKIMCVVLESPNKALTYIPIKSTNKHWDKESILDYFETEEEFIANSKKQYDIQTIKCLNKKYVGKEVYVKPHNGISSGYYILKNIELCPSNNEKDIYFKYYALLEDSNEHLYKFLITSDFEEKIIYAEEQRKIEEEQRKIEEEKARKQAQKEAEYIHSIYNQLLLNILRVISQKYGHNL